MYDYTDHVTTHCDEEIEEQSAAMFHFGLHGGAFLEVISIADDDGKVMASECRFCLGCVIICPTC